MRMSASEIDEERAVMAARTYGSASDSSLAADRCLRTVRGGIILYDKLRLSTVMPDRATHLRLELGGIGYGERRQLTGERDCE